MSGPTASPTWHPASFRDTRGRLFTRPPRIFRALTERGAEDWRALSASPVWAELQNESAVVRTWEPPDVAPEPPAVCILEHEPVSFVSYAFEWPFSLLKEAALLHVELMRRLLPAGFTLIDGTSRNVLFEGMSPILVDVLSIMPRRRGAIWYGLNQYLETMVYPLMLAAYKGISYHAWLRGASELALPTADVARLFGTADSFKPGVITLLKLKRALDRAGEGAGRSEDLAESADSDETRVLHRTIDRLGRVVEGLTPRFEKSHWTSYDSCVRENYGGDAHARKQDRIETIVRRAAPQGTVWDLGCNTGEYSLLAAPHARLVVAIDGDHAVVEAVCGAARARGQRNVLPLVSDLAWPSPALGWEARECRALWSRGPADLLLALAVEHHVVLARHVPCDLLLATLARIGRRCAFEFIDPQDPQARQMARRLGEGHQVLPVRQDFEALCRREFEIEETTNLTDTRSLYVLRSLTVG